MSLPSARLVCETPQRISSTRGHILQFTICAWSPWQWRVTQQHHIKAWTGTHAMVSNDVNRSVAWIFMFGPKDDDVLISWRRVGLAVWFCSAIFNVYIQTVGTNRAWGSFTMQGICGWPIHSARWLSLNMACQRSAGYVNKLTAQLIFSSVILTSTS